jgi:hypothetical protein
MKFDRNDTAVVMIDPRVSVIFSLFVRIEFRRAENLTCGLHLWCFRFTGV